MFFRFTRAITLVLVIAVITACATTGGTDTTTPDAQSPGTTKPASKVDAVPSAWAKSKVQREQVNQWELRGRLSIQTRNDGGIMDIIWKQYDDEYSIRLLAPLGSGSYLIEGNSNYAVIRYPDGARQTVDDIDQIFQKALDLKLPVSALKDWVRGLPAHKLKTSKTVWNDQGLIKRLYQAGWNIEMSQYAGAHLLMPHAIYLSHLNDTEVDVRLILNQWLIDN